MKRFSTSKGFTLIELLVVIAVLGVLAAGVFTAINPTKRINQANDAKIKSDTGQISQAMQAYYTTNLVYPTTVAALVTSKDLKVEPKVPPAGTASYTGGCIVATGGCSEISIRTALLDPVTAGDVWCWQSSTGQAKEVALASCTP